MLIQHTGEYVSCLFAVGVLHFLTNIDNVLLFLFITISMNPCSPNTLIHTRHSIFSRKAVKHGLVCKNCCLKMRQMHKTPNIQRHKTFFSTCLFWSGMHIHTVASKAMCMSPRHYKIEFFLPSYECVIHAIPKKINGLSFDLFLSLFF